MRKTNILLVEDNCDDELLVKRAFQKANVKGELAVARDGAEALEYLFCTGKYLGREATEQMPQIVFLDLSLPKLNGHEVLRAIRSDERTKFLPTVIFTSSREERDLLEGYQGGANSYVVKPVDPVQFEESIRQLGRYWLQLNEPVP